MKKIARDEYKHQFSGVESFDVGCKELGNSGLSALPYLVLRVPRTLELLLQLNNARYNQWRLDRQWMPTWRRMLDLN